VALGGGTDGVLAALVRGIGLGGADIGVLRDLVCEADDFRVDPYPWADASSSSAETFMSKISLCSAACESDWPLSSSMRSKSGMRSTNFLGGGFFNFPFASLVTGLSASAALRDLLRGKTGASSESESMTIKGLFGTFFLAVRVGFGA